MKALLIKTAKTQVNDLEIMIKNLQKKMVKSYQLKNYKLLNEFHDKCEKRIQELNQKQQELNQLSI